MPGDDRVALDLEAGHVGRETHAEPRRDAGREIAALRRGGEEGRAIAAGADPLSAVAADTSGL